MDLVCSDVNFLKNPQKLPLNKLYLQCDYINTNSKSEASVSEMLKLIEKPPDEYGSHYSVKTERKPAIDKCWIHQNRRFVTFQSYYVQFDDKENSQFFEENQAYLDSLQFFLTCRFQQFWCYVAHEPRFANALINFLENAIPPCAVKYINDKNLSLYNEIYGCIYRIYERLITFTVSETEFIEEDAAVKYLRLSNLINSRNLMNFCYLYLHSRKDFVQNMIHFCYSSKFRDVYLSELTLLWEEVFDDLDQLSMRAKLGTFNAMYIEETACYLVEAAQSLSKFTRICEPAIQVALEQQFLHRLPHIYQKVYLDLYDMCDLKEDFDDCSKLSELINQWLALGRQFFIEVAHNFIDYCLKKILEFRDQQHEQEEYLEIYIALISTGLDDDFFIRDYNQQHSIKQQFKLLHDNIPNFDKSHTEYLLQSLSTITAKVPQATTSSATPREHTDTTSQEPFPQDLYNSIYNTLSLAVPGSNQPDNVLDAIKKYEQLIKQWELNPNRWIIEEMPDMFVDNNFEDWKDFKRLSEDDISKRIATVKEMLPDLSNDYILKHLERVDYKPELVISHILDEGNSSPSTSQKMIAHIGKKPQHSDARDLLNDKNDDIKQLVLSASRNYEVDDDYDDRNEIYGNFEPDKDDSKLYRHMKPNNLEYNVISDPSSSEIEDEASADSKPRDAFCEDPAVIRARRAAQRGRFIKPSPRNVDVVGKPKGQGQETSVQQNRDKKNVHKSSRANHNRKGGAQWKRSRGMMPS